MLPRSAYLPVVALCALALQPCANTQQFRSGRPITINSVPPKTYLGPVYGVADFNGDGRPDLLVEMTGPSGNSLAAVMLQNSNGTFTEKVTSMPLGTTATLAADLNGDGKTDIVTVLPGPMDPDHGDPLGPATMVIAYGNGDGTFRVQAPMDVGGDVYPTSMQVVDLNHDGKPDVVALVGDQYSETSIVYLLNNGDGTFRGGVGYTGLMGGELLASGDFNGDGYGDIVINSNDSQTQILLGKGDGSFKLGATYNVNANSAGVGDFNRDHHADLALVTLKNTVVLLGKGDGTFSTSSTLDISEINPPTVGNSPSQAGIYVGDLNKDGNPDFVINSYSSPGPDSGTSGVVSVYYGKGNGTFTNPKVFNTGGTFAYEPLPVSFGDVNRDGRVDVITASSGQYAIAYGSNDGGFNAPIIAQAPVAGSIAKGDFNGDGIEDIAVVDEPPLDCVSSCNGTSVRIFLGTGKGYFSAPSTYAIPVKWGAIAAGDVNRDGKVDLVVTRNAYWLYSVDLWHYTTPDLAVLLGRGDGTFETPASYTLLGAPAPGTLSDSVNLVDVNHDGKLDLVGDWGTALGNGIGQFAKPIPLPSGIGTVVAMAPGDFRASGTVDLEVATVNYSGSGGGWGPPEYVYTLAGNGKGSFTIAGKHPVSGFPTSLIAKDINGDGLDDVLYMFTSLQGSATYINLGVDLSRGQGTFTSTTYFFPFSDTSLPTDIVMGDFNRDGKIDAALFGPFANGADVAVVFGAGSGSFSNNAQYYRGGMGKGVVLDVNGDGAPDIVGTTIIGVSRLLNTGHK